MLKIKKNLYEQMIQHLKKQIPYEGCGILSGNDGNVLRVYEMTNGAKREDFFLMVPEEQFEVIKDIRKNGQKMLAIFHSHPVSRAYPSAKDIDMAYYDDIHYIIVSFKDEVIAKAYKINRKDKIVIEEKLIIEE